MFTAGGLSVGLRAFLLLSPITVGATVTYSDNMQQEVAERTLVSHDAQFPDVVFHILNHISEGKKTHMKEESLHLK